MDMPYQASFHEININESISDFLKYVHLNYHWRIFTNLVAGVVYYIIIHTENVRRGGGGENANYN